MAVDPRLRALRNVRKQEKEEKKYDPAEQAEGLKKRFEAAGIDGEKASDDRNLFEKAFNLPDKQNILFDVFEILNRPQQALFNAIKSDQDGGDMWQGALEGIKGNRKVQFKEILNDAGITEETEGKLGMDDVFGFAGDVLLDPLDWAFLPAKGIKAATKAVDTANDTLRLVSQSLELAQSATKTADSAKAIAEAERAVRLAKGVAEDATSALAKLPKGRRTIKQLTMQGVGSGFKGMFNITDSGITKTLEFFDRRSGAGTESLANLYKGAKDSITRTFNMAKTLPENFMSKIRKVTGSKDLTKKTLFKKIYEHKDAQDKLIASLVDKTGMATDDVELLLKTIYERADLFDFDGKVTLAGMKDKTSISDILGGSSKYIENQGLTKENVDIIDQWIKTYLPKWYESNVGAGSTMDNVWIVRKSSTGKLKDTYSVNPDLQGSLEREFQKLKDGTEILTDHMDKLDVNELAEFEELSVYVKDLKEQANKGNKVIPKSNPVHVTVKRYQDSIRDLGVEKEELLNKINKVRETKAQLGLKQLEARVTEIEAQVVLENKLISKFIDKHGRDASEILGEVTGRLTELQERAMYGKLDIEHYMTDNFVKELEGMLKYEETAEMMTSIHMLNTYIADTTQKMMGSGFNLTDGYIAHTMTKEWNDLQLDKWISDANRSFASTGSLKGNSRAFLGRKYKVSTLEANDMANSYIQMLGEKGLIDKANLPTEYVDLFAKDINTSIVDFAVKNVQTTADAHIYKYVLEDIFLDYDKAVDRGLIIKRDPAVHKGVPSGYKDVTLASLKEKLDGMAAYLNPDDAKALKAAFADHVTTQGANTVVFLDKNIERLIGRMFNKKETGEIMKIADKINNMFKANKLLSPGFQLRNIVGNISNMWLSGMSVPDILSEIYKSNKIINKMTKGKNSILNKVAQNVELSPDELALYTKWTEFAQYGFADYGNALHDIPEEMLDRSKKKTSMGRKIKQREADVKAGVAKTGFDSMDVASAPRYALHKVQEFNMSLNEAWDARSRFALWNYASENPKWMAKNGYEDSISVVRRSLYDYTDLSSVEQDYIKKIVPFYTFAKKNLGFHMNNFIKETSRYSRLHKAFNSAWNTLDLKDDEKDNYKIENFWIPIPKIGEDGSYMSIKSSLPIGDFGEFLEDPFKRGIASMTPLIRAPFEMAMNSQAFSGMPIQEFKGQKGFYIPEISKKAEYALSQTGLDVPAMAGFDIGRTVSRLAKGEQEGNPLGDAFGRTVISKGNAEKTAQRAAYEELDQLQNMLRYYKQEGVEIPKLSEINNREKFNAADNLLRRIRAIRR